MKRAILTRKVQHVEKAVANGFSVEDAIQRLITDRVAMNEVPSAGAKPVMRRDEFVSALKQNCTHEQAASKETAAAILAEAKVERYSMKGLRCMKSQARHTHCCHRPHTHSITSTLV
jgi:hypothetical protein